MTDLVLRPIDGPDELSLFTRLPYVLNTEPAGDLAAGHRRPEWMWMALRGGRTSGPPPTSATSRWPGSSPEPDI